MRDPVGENVKSVAGNGGLLLEHFARLATVVTGTTSVMLLAHAERKDDEPRSATIGLTPQDVSAIRLVEQRLQDEADLTVIPDLTQDQRFIAIAPAFVDVQARFLVFKRLVSSAQEPAGFLCVLASEPRARLTNDQCAALEQIANAVMADRQREQRHRHLMHVADRALRIDRMLRLVSEAPSCTDALIGVLETLCHLHGAAIGQILQLIRPDRPLTEISRYDHETLSGTDRSLSDLLVGLNQVTMETIQSNKPRVIKFDGADASEFHAEIAAPRLSGYLCLPIWVHHQRFGIVLGFTTEMTGLDTIAANIASLADTIRPALFQKVTEERIRHAAYHDDLTQLPNRLMFQERLRTAIATARSGGSGFAVLCLDLDGFKRVNDTFGHGFGDGLLVGVAQRLCELTDEKDTVARVGGDEFAIIHPSLCQPDDAVSLARQLLEAIRQPIECLGRKATVGLSIGVAAYGLHGDSPDLLMRRADQALYRSKQLGRMAYCVYDPAMGAEEEELFLIERDLKDAIGRGELALAYQPVCDCKSQHIVSFEALLRWHHPILGWIRPDKFIPIAEKSGDIVALGKWALETACAEAACWDKPVSVAVNLSPLQFRQPDLTEQVADILERTGLPAERLVLEVTEGMLLDDSDHIMNTMRSLQSQGIHVVLDDFGTAYASMSYLRRFPFNGIKIDKSFVRGLHNDSATVAIVQTILTLARQLNLVVTAEGVESELELNMLRKLGCSLVQGYLVGRPSERHHARRLLRQSWANGMPKSPTFARTADRFGQLVDVGEEEPPYPVPASHIQ